MKYLFFIFLSFNTCAQTEKYDWDPNPKPYKDTVGYKDDAVILMQLNDVNLSGSADTYKSTFITHIKTLVLTEAGIEKTNKFYYYIDESKKLKEIKARVITPSGKIINVPEDHIINSLNEDKRTEYKYFAYEGVEKGSILEVFLLERLTKANADLVLMEDLFRINAEFKILDYEARFTRNREFQFKYEITLNKEMYKITEIKGVKLEPDKTIIKGVNIPKYIEEPYTHRTDYLGYVYFQMGLSWYLDMNGLANFRGKRFLVGEITNQEINEKRLYSLLNSKIDTVGLTNIEKLYAVENYIKAEGKSVEKNNVSVIRLDQPNFTQQQQLKLIYQYAKLFQLEPTIIMTTDNNRLKISNEFDAPFLYTDQFILFPKEQLIYYPSKFSRIHAISQDYLNNRYLNTATFTQNEFQASKPEFSIDSIKITLQPNFNDLIDSISLYRQTSGHFCNNFLSESEVSSYESKLNAMSFFCHYHLPECEVHDSIIENDNFIYYMKKPLIGKFKATSSSDIIEVDKGYLLAIGKYIGEQPSLHNEKAHQRYSPIRTGQPHIYKRVIEVKIPENFEVKNLNDLIISTSDRAKELGMGFESNYLINKNILTITIREWYNHSTYQSVFYRYFLEVMNTAADFNNFQLVFEKK